MYGNYNTSAFQSGNNGFNGGFSQGGQQQQQSQGFSQGGQQQQSRGFSSGNGFSQGGQQSQGFSRGGYSNNQGAYGAGNGGYGQQQDFTGFQNAEPKANKHEAMLAAGSSAEAEAFRKEKHIRILSNAAMCPAPLQSFEALADYNVPEYLYKNFLQNQMGFSAPSPIQAQTWPVALSGRDMIGIAETGSGKTLSFLLPGAVHIAQNEQPLARGETGPICLVLAPTRELAQQIEAEAIKLSNATDGSVRTTCLVGGVPKGPQARDLRFGKEVVIATPGRLLDLLDDNRVGFSLHRVSYLCLDEADRMLDMGFEKDIRRIMSLIQRNGNKLQTMLFSATWPKEVQKLARDLCSEDPVHVHIGEGNLGELKANPRITQNVEMIDSYSVSKNTMGCSTTDVDSYKIDRIAQILKEETNRAADEAPGAPFKTIIFCMTKKGCDWVSRRLSHLGALAIHGDKSQQDRDWTLQQFKMGTDGQQQYGWQRGQPCNILVATDVAARGLDIKNVELVVNYDFPLNIEDYVHRIGRTGRAGKFGVSCSFFCRDDLKTAAKSAHDLVGIMRKAGQNVSEELQALADRGAKQSNKGHPRYGGGNKGFGKSSFGGSKGGYGGNKGYGKGASNNKGGYESYSRSSPYAANDMWR